MTDNEFLDVAEHALQTIESDCDRINAQSDADIDNQRAGGMVTLTFADRSQIVVNMQKPLRELWLASRAGGHHYRWDGAHWMDTKGAGELFERLSQAATDHAGMPLQFGG